MTGQVEVITPAEFRARLVIKTGAGERKLSEVIEPWQQKDFEATDAGWQVACGLLAASDEIKQRSYWEQPRGHSKTTNTAIQATYAIAFAPRSIRGLVAAGDKDQAKFIRDAIEILKHLNPWLDKLIKVNNWEVINEKTGSKLVIMAADAATTFGETPDFLIVEELTHWAGEKGEKFWDANFSSAAKVPTCMVAIIANAGNGQGKSWQWKVREAARTDAGWYFSRLDGPTASWITPKMLDEQRRLLASGKAFARLWKNQWQTGEGDALDPEAIESCVTLATKREATIGCIEYVAGLDLGVKNDRSALVVLGLDPRRLRLRLCECLSWSPDPVTGKVDLRAVRDAVWSADSRFGNGLAACYYDPHQAALMEQELGMTGINMVEMNFMGRNLGNMASSILGVFNSRAIEMYRDQQLIDDLLRLTIVEKDYGFKLEAISDDLGHADTAIALAIALPRAIEFLRELREVISSGQDAPQEYYA